MCPSRLRKRHAGRVAAYFRPTTRARAEMTRSIGVERRSLSVQVADTLRELIISNTYTHGHPLRQDEVAKRLGVSHIPVRSAFQVLESEGLITNVPYKGAIVTRL